MNRIIMITGANNGIGLAIAQALLDEKDCVAALDLTLENLDQADPNLIARVCDVTDPERVQAVVDEVVRRWGGIDVLVNNACLALFKPFVDRGLDEIRKELEVNFFGYMNTIYTVLPVMRGQGHGVIHNLSSGVSYTGIPGMSGYTASKGAIESFTRTLALELADEGITVNIMHPPLTRTKSASGFGVPVEMMADPVKIGRGLARKIGSTQPTITPDFISALGIFGNQHFPLAMGIFLARMATRAREQSKE
jgi:NAD(P)-dependent dehydrogenase (short-subunit alcohol dehydrogenase family)